MSVGNFDYLRTSNATVLNKNGVLETVTANNAPIAFDASGIFLGLVVEPARTNLLLRSEEFGNASWATNNATVSSNQEIAPDGTLTADKIIETVTVGGVKQIGQTVTFADATLYTHSVFVKAAERSKIALRQQNSAARTTIFDLSNGTIFSLGPGTVSSITNFGKGWYRCSITTTTVTTGDNPIFRLLIADNAGNLTYNGDGTSGVYLWGAQLEAGANPTSYIQTVASTVTRTVATNFKAGLGDRVGQSEGTIYAQVNTASFNASRTIAALYTDANNELKIGKTNTGAFFASYKVGGTETVNVVNATAARVGNFKLAAAYNSTGMQLFINGANGGSNTAGAVTGFNTVSVGHGQAAVEQFAEPISAFVLFKRRLGTNELTSLTD